MYHDEDVDKLVPACYKAVLENLAVDDVAEGCERCIRRIIVQQELQPVTDLTDPDELGVQEYCHRWLYGTAKILHRDISVSNFMFQRIDDTLYGVLGDFDMTHAYGRDKGSVSKLHYGTKVYMAVDLLVRDPPKHEYRHDLESFLYVLVFLTCQIEGSQLADWNDMGMEGLKSSKWTAMSFAGFPQQMYQFANFDGWVGRLRALFRDGYGDRAKHKDKFKFRGAKGPFDELTLGGAVTFDKFEAVLDLDHLEAEAMEEEDDYAEEDEDVGGNGGEHEQEDGDYVNEDDDGEGEQDDDDYDFRLDRGRLTDLERYGR
ncbi:hypothetical protein C8R47DRAFT_1226577 [Mycena vitilis]|nr:hypothetical protein C8R47DRAFT_1226577 [Mycena vitilis]